jgi:hypothetical protein
LDPVYDRHLFQLKLNEMDAINEVTAHILNQLPENFTYNELKKKLKRFAQKPQFSEERQNRTFETMFWLANSNYEVNFHPITEYPNGLSFPFRKTKAEELKMPGSCNFSMTTERSPIMRPIRPITVSQSSRS